MNREIKGYSIYEYMFMTTYNNKAKRMIEQYGNKNIDEITIFRQPVNDLLISSINILTLNKFKQLLKKYGFDKLFHLGILIKFEDNSKVIVEKNEVVNIDNKISFNKYAQFMNVRLDKMISLNELLNNTISKVGINDFFVYSAFKNNCQKFIMDILKSNDLLRSEYKDFIYQDIQKLASELPSYSKTIIDGITDTGAIIDKISGNGVKKTKKQNVITMLKDMIRS